MKISVIAIFYKSEHYCKKCIDSILAQSGNFELELVLVDDNSPDNTFSLLKCYNDERIKTIRHSTNQGISAARNSGLKNISGDCFFFIDGDDYLPQGALSLLSEHYSPDIDWVQGGYAICDESDNIISIKNNVYGKYNSHQEIFDKFNDIEFVYTHNRLINAKWKDVEFPTGKAHEDRFWNVKVFSEVSKIINIPNITYNYIAHPQSFSNKSRSSKLYINSGMELLKMMRANEQCWQILADTFQITTIEKNLYLFSYSRKYRKQILYSLKLLHLWLYLIFMWHLY